MQQRVVVFFDKFSTHMRELKDISVSELLRTGTSFSHFVLSLSLSLPALANNVLFCFICFFRTTRADTKTKRLREECYQIKQHHVWLGCSRWVVL